MKPAAPPKAVAVEVVAAQPSPADKALVSRLRREEDKPLPGEAYIVRIALKEPLEIASRGWALYVDELRIPKYWQYDGGVYFKVFDPGFFAEHKGGKLRFTEDGTRFTDTGLRLPAPGAAKRLTRKSAARRASRLPD